MRTSSLKGASHTEAFYLWLAAETLTEANVYFSAFYEGFHRVMTGEFRKRYGRVSPDLIDDAMSSAMHTMLERSGEPRRAAIEMMPVTLARLQPLELGDLHARRLRRWKGRVAQYRLDVIQFAERAASMPGGIRGERIKALKEERLSLMNEGLAFIQEVRVNVGGQAVDLDARKKVSAVFIKELRDRPSSADATELDRGWALAGATNFLLSVDDLVAALQKVQALSVSYVHKVCVNELRHAFRRIDTGNRRIRSRQADPEDGSSALDGAETSASNAAEDDCQDEQHDEAGARWRIHLEQPGDSGDHFGRFDAESALDDQEDPTGRDRSGASDSPVDVEYIPDPRADVEMAAENAELFRSLQAALQEPIRLAWQRLKAAQVKRDRDRAQIQLDGAIQGHELETELLLGWSDGEGQQEMAERLQLSRNQVRYGLQRMARRIIQFCEERNIEFGDDLSAMADGRSRHATPRGVAKEDERQQRLIDGGSETGANHE